MAKFATTPNPLRDRFKREILKDGLPNAAAARAGYTSRSAGTKLLQIPEVVEDIKKLRRAQLRRLQMSADDALIGVSRVARFDPRMLFDEQGKLKQPKDWPEEVATCIASVEVEERWEGKGENRTCYHVHKIKFNDRMAALTLLMRHHNMFSEEARDIGRGASEGLLDLVAAAQSAGGGVAGLLAKPQALPAPATEVIEGDVIRREVAKA